MTIPPFGYVSQNHQCTSHKVIFVFWILGWTLEQMALCFCSIFSSANIIIITAGNQRTERVHTIRWPNTFASYADYTW